MKQSLLQLLRFLKRGGVKKMFDKIVALFNVCSIIAFALAGVFCYLAISGTITPEQFMSVFSMVISFYFVTKHNEEKV